MSQFFEDSFIEISVVRKSNGKFVSSFVLKKAGFRDDEESDTEGAALYIAKCWLEHHLSIILEKETPK